MLEGMQKLHKGSCKQVNKWPNLDYNGLGNVIIDLFILKEEILLSSTEVLKRMIDLA